MTERLVVGFSGDPGARIGVRLLELLGPLPVETHLVMCACSKAGLATETGRTADEVLALADRTYEEWNQAARISSGSYLTLGMVVAPCSRRSLASIAIGYANNLVHRAADVTIKEGRPLTLLVQEAVMASRVHAEHAERLRAVPNVEVRTVGEREEGDASALADSLHEVLARFAIPVPSRG